MAQAHCPLSMTGFSGLPAEAFARIIDAHDGRYRLRLLSNLATLSSRCRQTTDIAQKSLRSINLATEQFVTDIVVQGVARHMALQSVNAAGCVF